MKEIFDNRFSALEACFASDKHEIIQAHKGEWTHEDVESFVFDLESKLLEKGIKKGIAKRMFSLIIEALQNIRLHGERDENGVQQSFYFIALKPDRFTVITANVILNRVIEKVQTRIEKINELDKAGLKEYYMDTLTDGQRSSKGGAGLGFITVAMKAKNKIDYDFSPIDGNKSKFEMSCDILLTGEE